MTDLAALWASLPRIETVRVSADGRFVFWSWDGQHEVSEIYVAPTDASAPPRRLTWGNDHVYLRSVNRDGSRAIVARSRNANEHDQLLLLDVAGLTLDELTPEQSTHYLYGGVFSPDGSRIVFIADHDFETGQPTAGGWVWQQDLATGARSVLARTESPFERGADFNPSGTHLLWHRHDRAPGGTQVWVMGADGSEAREVLCFGERSTVTAHWLSDDEIAFVADGPGHDRLGILAVASGKIRWLADEPDFHPHDVVTGQGGTVACIAHRDSRTEAVIFDAAGRHLLPNATGRRSVLVHVGLPDGGWIAEAYDADAPAALVRIAPDGSAIVLAEAPPVAGRRFVSPVDYRWISADGTPVQGWFYRPETPSRGLIAHIHGGPTWHSEDWVNPAIAFWVQSGYSVLDPNYRGSTGFGMAWREAVKTDGWGGREQDDIRAGIEALIADGHAVPGRIAVAGNSYGGFSSWVAITRFADLVAAAIPMCGMYRLDIDYHETEMPHGRAYSEEMMGGTPEQFPEKYANASPGNFIDHIRGHLLIVHGLADSNVGPENTHAAVRELTAAGIPHEVLLFENEGHGVARRSNLEIYLDRSLAFLERAFAAGPWR